MKLNQLISADFMGMGAMTILQVIQKVMHIISVPEHAVNVSSPTGENSADSRFIIHFTN
jgi:hypothetical protein